MAKNLKVYPSGDRGRLEQVIAREMLGTPTARDHKGRGRAGQLPTQLLPTPQAFDSLEFVKKDLTDKTTKNGKKGGRANLRESFPLLATPAAADCQGSHGGGQGKTLRTDIHEYRAETGERGNLSPLFTGMMMGFPDTWFEIE